MNSKDAIFLLCEECNFNPLDEKGNLKTGIKWRISLLEKSLRPEDIETFIKRALLSIKTEFLRKGEMVSIATLQELLTPSTDNLEMKAVNAFETIIKKLNQYRDFVTDDKRAICALSRIGGWLELCNSNIDSIPYKREKFIKSYISCSPDQIEHKRFFGIGTTDKCIYLGSEENKHLLENKSNQQIDFTKLLEGKNVN